MGKLGRYHEKRQDEILDHLVDLASDANYRTRLGAIAGMVELEVPKAEGALTKIEDTAILGALRRNARRAIHEIREKHAEGAKRLDQQSDIDKLKDENKELKTRLASLEAKIDAIGKKRR